MDPKEALARLGDFLTEVDEISSVPSGKVDTKEKGIAHLEQLIQSLETATVQAKDVLDYLSRGGFWPGDGRA